MLDDEAAEGKMSQALVELSRLREVLLMMQSKLRDAKGEEERKLYEEYCKETTNGLCRVARLIEEALKLDKEGLHDWVHLMLCEFLRNFERELLPSLMDDQKMRILLNNHYDKVLRVFVSQLKWFIQLRLDCCTYKEPELKLLEESRLNPYFIDHLCQRLAPDDPEVWFNSA